MNPGEALIVTDVQNDFCPGGALPVQGGDAVVPVINRLMDRFPLVVATQDWHPPGHISFASTHPGKKVHDTIETGGLQQVLWPDHCVQGTAGADFHPDLDKKKIRAVFRKGAAPDLDSYSGFRDNAKIAPTGLAGYLRELGVGRVRVAGLATDFCVFFTARDALERGFETGIVLDACRGIDLPPGSLDEKLAEFRGLGGFVLQSGDLLKP